MTVRRCLASLTAVIVTVFCEAAAAQNPPAKPLPRSGHALVYDPRLRAVILINGDHALESTAGEVWAWSSMRGRVVRPGAGLTIRWRLIDTSGPPPRTLAGVAYDTRRGVLVMQGGIGGGDTLYGDTQEWDGVQWRQVSQEGPGIRNHQAMAYDKARGVTVLFGGQDRDIVLQRDTWEWDGVSWRRVATTGPSARVHHALVYDEARQRVLLYGGSNQSGSLSDFWEWDGASWRRIDAQGPGPRSSHQMAFHPDQGTVYLLGDDADDRVWTWNGLTWSLFNGPTPTAHGLPGMAYDETRKTLVVFGGYHGVSNLADTWELIGDRWVRVDSGN